ncbi:MAG TPA: nickel pincer cofactor biosynthesis protein LarC [Terracidiphilus sp.]|nr:nickel pincer cofactor biosynthesis protein LarC [Terracidiphilus sp.]
MRIGYLECFSGISGDMLLGALVDAGVPFSVLEDTAAALNVGAKLEMHKVMRGGLTATKVDVITPEQSEAAHEHSPQHDHAPDSHEHAHSHDHDHDPHRHENEAHHDHGAAPSHKEHTHSHGDHEHSQHEHHSHAPHRSLSSILGIIRAAPLGERVKERSSRAFQLLGEAEAEIHSIPVEKVHFHEVGAVDTIADIVCSAAGCEALGVDRWVCSPLNVGSGTVKCAHGTLPVPAPATIALLGDAPVYAAGDPMERVTPTGAAILRMLDVRYAPLPAMRVQSRGYGAGGRDTPGTPNLLRILVGEAAEETLDSAATEPIAVIEATIDDSSPQLLGYASDRLLAAGAWDVYRQAVQMKKGRTGVQLTVLCRPDLVPALRELLFRETTTIGLRWRLENKLALAREFAEVETQWGKVKIKIARLSSGEIANAAPEYEDCRRLAEQHAVPLKQVMQVAMRIYAGAHAGAAEARA